MTANGSVYIGARDGRLHAFDAAAKTEIWTYQLGGFVSAAPAISDGILYATSGDGNVYAFTNATADKPTEDVRQQGTVAHDAAPVYIEKDGASVLLQLNDGVHLPIVQISDEWYEVELPNGVRGWMNQLAFGEFKKIDGILFNATFCGTQDHSAKDPYRVQLIEGAEFPRWSPDGELIAFLKRTDLGSRYWRANELWIMDRKGERARKFYTGRFLQSVRLLVA